jgi:hypothetical protein
VNSADDFAAWSLETSEGATLEVGLTALALRGGLGDDGTSSAVCEVPDECDFFIVTVTILARKLDVDDRCYFTVGVEGEYEETVALLVDGQDQQSSPDFNGITRSTVVPAPGPGQRLVLKLSLDHSDWHDYCYLRALSVECSAATLPTTAAPTTFREYGVPCPLFETSFDCDAELLRWTYSGSYIGQDTIPGWDNGALLLRNAGSVTHHIDVDMPAFEQVQVYTKMSARSLEGSETCKFVVSFDGFVTTNEVVESLEDVDDSGEIIISGIVTFRAEDYVAWDSLDLRFVSDGDQNNDRCYLHEVGVSGLKLPARRLLRGKDE